MTAQSDEAIAEIIASTRTWIERAVIGLNLCPFAKAVYAKEQIRYVVSEALSTEALIEDLRRELGTLNKASPEDIATTLLIHPRVLNNFLDYNDFLESADELVVDMDLEGVIQVASFHPRYQFSKTTPENVINCTNRSPYPTLHLLREADVDTAVAAFPDAKLIYERNNATLRKLGVAGWRALGVDAPDDGKR
ncbi:MAG: DUF1415 domain-containing protein [Betaproteobacteria bacterium]|nr:DUF1415 domain-containing protein [Betaproteobacteria bacterium]